MVERSFSILHLFSYHLYTGPAEPILNLARAQREAGYDARLAIDTLRDGDLVERAKEFGVPLDRRFALSVKAGPILHMRDILVFKRLWASEEFDILHAHRSHEHTLAALARPRKSRKGRTRLIRTLHTERAISKNRKWQLRRADGLITIAKKYSQELIERGVLPEEQIVNISGAVDCARFCPASDDLTLRNELGIGPTTPLAGMVARMKSGRGHALLLSAWEKVSARLPDARLAIAGRGELESELKDRVTGSALSESVTFLGYRDDLPGLYRGLDLKVLLAPGNDGTCRAALEAMASGV
ncbi:MAG: glycosyltransferase, partial [Deltaproteobacteria bacterium]|nr:glycosyltransferase [Deltaproteobacteria bacterium]